MHAAAAAAAVAAACMPVHACMLVHACWFVHAAQIVRRRRSENAHSTTFQMFAVGEAMETHAGLAKFLIKI
jgi:hypothetical protein